MDTKPIKAFTLIELLVVITIIGILAGLIIVYVSGATDKATIAKLQTYSNSLRDSLGSGLVSEWQMNEGTGQTVADTWSGNTGTLGSTAGVDTNDPTWITSGCISNSCLSFDGNDYINVGNVNLNLTNQMSAGFWVKFTGLDYATNTGNINTFFAKGNPDNSNPSTGFWVSYDNRNNSTSFTYSCFGNSTGGASGGGNNFANCPYTFANNTWYYISFIIESSNTAKIFINGNKIGVNKTFNNLSLSNTTDNLYIGSKVNFWYLKGVMDEVRIYNTAISTAEIKQQYYAGLKSLLAKNQITEEEYQQKISEK
jgi:prepilin-type N-terminal cleavage/methylation domain-containing protein